MGGGEPRSIPGPHVRIERAARRSRQCTGASESLRTALIAVSSLASLFLGRRGQQSPPATAAEATDRPPPLSLLCSDFCSHAREKNVQLHSRCPAPLWVRQCVSHAARQFAVALLCPSASVLPLSSAAIRSALESLSRFYSSYLLFSCLPRSQCARAAPLFLVCFPFASGSRFEFSLGQKNKNSKRTLAEKRQDAEARRAHWAPLHL